ncbi:NAD-dependent epimerase/dehydratase family protein [Streptosporangiaceae bacterium NEAU-GS5]|nr:NAD-dependent epimerase/dehydratase family protein [Streptosporangiaceae bacterium NEAU-GS5]
MRVLVIGGSMFLGRAVVEEALRRGDEVTTFNRGRSRPDLPGVEAVHGDRGVPADLRRLVRGREWDTVIDVCGFIPKNVRETARTLSGHAGHYTFISTIRALSDWPEKEVDESSALHACPPDAEDGEYEVLKAGCERAVEQFFDGGALIIQPGVIIGPHEHVGRLPWWLTRIARGGRVLAPGDPHREMQLIDARDIAAFVLARAARRSAKRFVTCGTRGSVTFGSWLAACVAVTGSDAELVWVDDHVLLKNGVRQLYELPLWLADTPASAAAWRTSPAKALAAGLVCRPIEQTVRDTWEWLREIPEDERSFGTEQVQHGIAPDKETLILTAWNS